MATVCEHYRFDQTCPYGDQCPHAHINPDGTYATSTQKPYERSGPPIQVLTIGELSKVFTAVDDELISRYQRALQPPKLSYKTLCERIKVFVTVKLNRRFVNAQDWNAIYGIGADFLEYGLDKGRGDEVSRYMDRLHAAGRTRPIPKEMDPFANPGFNPFADSGFNPFTGAEDRRGEEDEHPAKTAKTEE